MSETRVNLPFAKPLPDLRAAHAAATRLEADYLKTHKRKMTIDLSLSSQSKPFLDDRQRPRMGVETICLRAVYESNDPAQVDQVSWLAGRAKELTL